MHLLDMPPRNLTPMEICNDKADEIIRLRLELRQIIQRLLQLRNRMTVAEKDSLKFADRILMIRTGRSIGPRGIITEEIQDYQNRVERLNQDVRDHQTLINDLDRQKDDLWDKIEEKRQQFQQYVIDNGLQINGEEEEEEEDDDEDKN